MQPQDPADDDSPEQVAEKTTAQIWYLYVMGALARFTVASSVVAGVRVVLAVLGAFAVHWVVGVVVLAEALVPVGKVLRVTLPAMMRVARRQEQRFELPSDDRDPTVQSREVQQRLRRADAAMPATFYRWARLICHAGLGGFTLTAWAGLLWPGGVLAVVLVLSPWWNRWVVMVPLYRPLHRIVAFGDPTRRPDSPEC